MYLTKTYEVAQAEQFSPANYPEVMTELAVMRKDMRLVPVYYRGEIAIMYYRDHCLTHQWILTNPELTKLVTAGTYDSAHIEALFVACRRVPAFLAAYEAYIHLMLTDESTYFVSHEG
jgi:hypothetical protein